MMLQSPPARPGMREDEIDTPALLIDMEAFEANLDTMSRTLGGTGVKLRAHAKTHKSPVIAHLQIARGAVGQCVQKVGEAEALAWGGVHDIVVSNEVVGAEKLARLAALARIARISVCADDAAQVAALETAASEGDVRLEVLVEIDAGGQRCGVAPGPGALVLAKQIASSPHLTFGGIQAYHGSAQHLRTTAERCAAIDFAVNAARTTVQLLRDNGLECRIVGGGGTGTFALEAGSGIYNEVQAGSYIFMDADYARNLDESGVQKSPFCQSLFVLSSVMSAPRPGVAVLDAGHKAVSTDSGLPLVWQRDVLRYVDASDEHGKLEFDGGVRGPKLGEKLRLIPGHCDPTVDRHDWYVCVRQGRVEALWPIAARGCGS